MYRQEDDENNSVNNSQEGEEKVMEFASTDGQVTCADRHLHLGSSTSYWAKSTEHPDTNRYHQHLNDQHEQPLSII